MMRGRVHRLFYDKMSHFVLLVPKLESIDSDLLNLFVWLHFVTIMFP
jgi:hypothetical protein